ncbi:hypothetical protein HRbin19_00743 [bacterium HR19]|nr:hypothetical protein HRbin19_00743 [bacterium HR19]
MASKKQQLELFKKEKEEIYCIDASSIINLFRHSGLRYSPYPEDIFPGLWEKLEKLIKTGRLISLSHNTVLKEVRERDDEAKKWCEKHKKIFKDIDDCQISKIEDIKTQYSKRHWEAEINRKGREWADPWVIALAICEEALIISDEKNAPDRIPYIANHFGITTLNLMDFFRKIGLRLK